MGGNHIFTEHEFRVNLYEVERVLNNRPLIEVGEVQIITPAHFLGQSSHNLDNDFSSMDRERVVEAALKESNDLPHLFTQSQEKITIFWKTLWDQYLSELRFSPDRMGNRYTRVPRVGDICIIWQQDPRKRWKKARVLEVIRSDDGQIRECVVKMVTGNTTRSVNQLYFLEITAEERSREVISIAKDRGDKKGSKSEQPIRERPPRRLEAPVATYKNRELMLEDHKFQ